MCVMPACIVRADAAGPQVAANRAPAGEAFSVDHSSKARRALKNMALGKREGGREQEHCWGAKQGVARGHAGEGWLGG